MPTYSRVVMTSGVSAFGARNQLRAWAEEHGLLSWPDPKDLNPSLAPGLAPEHAYQRLRDAGAKEIHLRISCPPTPCRCWNMPGRARRWAGDSLHPIM